MDHLAERFHQTRWTTVLKSGDLSDPASSVALEQLCSEYRPPLLRFACYWLSNRNDIEDLVQGFFCHFIAKNLSGRANPEKGRFRSFLLQSFKHYAIDIIRRERQISQIPKEILVSVHESDNTESSAEPAFTPAMERKFDRLWAETVFKRAFQRTEKHFQRSLVQRRQFEKLNALLRGNEPQSYAQLAAELKTTEANIKVAVHRLRSEFAKFFRNEVEETATAEDVEAELAYLRSLLYEGEQDPAWFG